MTCISSFIIKDNRINDSTVHNNEKQNRELIKSQNLIGESANVLYIAYIGIYIAIYI